MKCPIDAADLQMTDRQGIEIDYCPTCRGVWLDRGELDKIIERSASFEAPKRENYQEPPRYTDHGEYSHKRRKESMLGDLFDF